LLPIGAESFVWLSKNIKIYRTIIFPIDLYGFGPWSHAVREERRLRVSENTVLRRIFGPKKNEVTGELRNHISKSLVSDLYISPNIILVIKPRRIR